MQPGLSGIFRSARHGIRSPLLAIRQCGPTGQLRFPVIPRFTSPQAWHRASSRNLTSHCTSGSPRNPTKSCRPKLISHVLRRPFRQSSRHQSPKGSATPPPPEPEPQSLTARLRKLSREYGWVAFGVYMGLTVIDLPFCFLIVKVVGTEKIAVAEEFLTSNIAKLIPQSVKDAWRNYRSELKKAGQQNFGEKEVEQVEMVGWGVEEAEARNKADASLATQLALAYAIHKSFIFIRVPLTAGLTPKVVKVLRSWGWKIGKRKSKQ